VRSPAEPSDVPASCAVVLTEVNAQLGRGFRWQRQLVGGEQTGAHVVVGDDQLAVLKWELAGWRAGQLLRAFPAVVHATRGGWPAARWLATGPLRAGGAFLLQEFVEGVPMSVIDVDTAEAVIRANSTQAGRGMAVAVDDSAQIEAVLSGDHPWKGQVAGFTAAGAALVQHGDEVAAWAGAAALPRTDVVHGDYSSSNILISPMNRTVTFIDCQTIGRGSRVRDLADLYRQSFTYPNPANTGTRLLRTAGIAAEGPHVFAKCAVAVTYNNLAWWAENKEAAEFDLACARLHYLFDDVRRGG
jgi:aminoglycoside phosphotransferase (APT) family kinase protein